MYKIGILKGYNNGVATILIKQLINTSNPVELENFHEIRINFINKYLKTYQNFSTELVSVENSAI